MSQFWNQLKDRVQARGAQANSTIGIIGGADGPTAVFVSTKPDSWLGTLLGLLPWGTGIISAGLLLGTAAANAFSTGLWFSAATLVWSLAVLFRRRAS